MNKNKNWELYSVELAKAKINFYEPFERLFLRKIVEDVLGNLVAQRIDLFAIFDAVTKRGGLSQVEENKRWIEIEYSLPYYKCNFKEIYQEHISKKEDEIKRYLKLFDKEYTTNEETFIEIYFLTNSSAGGFYHFEDDENSFCKHNFTYVDQYLSVKSISTFPCPINKIPAEYAEKYLLTRKWMILKGFSRPFSEEELDRVHIMKIYNNNASIALIGWNLPNLLLAFKLHELKFNVVLYTNNEDQYDMKTLERMLSIKEGVFIFDNGIGGPFSYSELFANHGVELGEICNYCTLMDENGRILPEFRVRESEELFLSLLADFKFEDSNKKLLKNEIHTLLSKKRLSDEYDLMKWHLERYLMLNNFFGEETTVALHSNYLNRRKHKIFMEKKRPVFIKNCMNLVEKAFKSFKIIQLKPKFIDFCNNIWLVEERTNEKRSFSSLVYSDSEQINDMICKRNFKIPGMENENFTVLRELSSNAWIHCGFRFKEKLKLKAEIESELTKKSKDFLKFCHYNLSEGNCSFQYSGTFGFYYYYIVEEGLGLIASCKVEKLMVNSSTTEQLRKSLASDILKQFEINILSYKLPELSEPEAIEFSHSFYLKDETLSRDRIIKLKNWERMYLLIGYPWALNPNKLTSQIDCSNQILALIANVHYPLLKIDTSAKDLFNNAYKKRKEEILLQEKESLALKKITSEASENRYQSQPSMKVLSQENFPEKEIELEKPEENAVIELEKNEEQEIEVSEEETKIKINIEVSFNTLPSREDIFYDAKESQDQEISIESFTFNNEFFKECYNFVEAKISCVFKQIQEKLNNLTEESSENEFEFFRKKITDAHEIFSSFERSFELEEPKKLSHNMYLHSLGKSRLENISIKKITEKIKKIQEEIRYAKDSGEIIDEKTVSFTIDLFLFDGYMSKIEFYSLDDPNETVIYVQTLIYIEQKNYEDNLNSNIVSNFIPLHVIFDDTNLALFFYHSSLQKLTSMLNAHVEKRKNEATYKRNSVFRRKSNSKNLTYDSNKIKLMIEEIKIKIQDEIDSESEKSDFFSQNELLDKILIDKLNSNVPEDFNQIEEENVLFSKVLYPESNEQKTQFLMNSLKKMAETELKSYQLKSEITLMDVFFGYLSSEMFVFEFFWNRKIEQFSKSATAYLETFDEMLEHIKKDDIDLYSEIKKIKSEKKERKYSDYPLNVDFNEKSLIVSRKELILLIKRFLASKNDPIEIKEEIIEERQIDSEENQKNKTKNIERSSYTVTKNQLLKNYIFIKEFTFKEINLADKKSNKERVHCFLLIGEDDRKLEIDPREDPLELIVSILVDTWDYQEIYDHFRNLLLSEILNCEENLSKKMSLYYQSTRKISQPFNFSEIPQLTSTLNYKKPQPKGNKYLSSYQTQYCNDEDDRETLLEHLENQNIVFSDGEIIFCKY